MADNQGLLQVSDEQRDELESWAQSRSLPAGDVFRARLILALADGLTYREIERKLGASAPTVSKWKGRFEQAGMEGLQGQHQGSKPRRATPAVQARVIRRAQQKPSDGSTHWSCRKLSEELGSVSRRCSEFWRRPSCGRIGWTVTWPATIRILRPRPPISSGCI